MLRVEDLTRTFGDHVAVDRFHLTIAEGEFVTLLGPSGSGKSTVLRMVAGLLRPTRGKVWIAGKDVTDLAPQARDIGLVFQSYALFPHMTAAQNIAFPLKVRKWDKASVNKRVDEMLELVGLKNRAQYLPEHLSGGERQRIALARSLSFRPPLLLLDEPLSALDAKVRVSLRDSLKAIQSSMGVTTLMVTHDQEEALELADRIVVMNNGRIEQIGTPLDVYYEPMTPFTAQFIGSVTSLEAKVMRIDPIRNGYVRTALDWQGCEFEWLLRSEDAKVGATHAIYVRPEAVNVSLSEQGGAVKGRVVSRTFMGAMTRLTIQVGNEKLVADVLSHRETGQVHPQEVFVRIVDVRLRQDAATNRERQVPIQ